VSAARLHGQLGLTEQAGILGGTLRGERDVVLARDEKDRCLKAGQGGSGGFRVEGAGRVVDSRRIRIFLARLPGEVGLSNGVPSAVGEGCNRLPVSGRGVARPDPLECGEGVREPGLPPAQFGDLPTIQVGDLQADRPRARIDQRETADAVEVPGGVQEGERRTGGVTQQVDSVQPEVYAQRFDVVDQPITPVTRRVRREGRSAGDLHRPDGMQAACRRHHRRLPCRDHMRGHPELTVTAGRPPSCASTRQEGHAVRLASTATTQPHSELIFSSDQVATLPARYADPRAPSPHDVVAIAIQG
jgi:hypothetical protein